jgi:hypothetical protein
MTMTERHASAGLEHEVGVEGVITLRLEHGEVRLHGSDGDRAVVRSRRGSSLDELVVERGDGSLAISSRRDGIFGTGRRGRGRGGIALELDVPRRAAIVVESGDADVSADGLAGEQRYRTASGDVRLLEVNGTIGVDAVSGDVEVRASGTASLALRTVSGDLEIHAATIARLRATTTSGDLDIEGRFQGEGPFSIETVSGDARLAPANDVRVETSTISGDVASELEATRDGRRGRHTLVIGRGDGPLVTFRSTSGDLVVTRPTAPSSAPATESEDPVAQMTSIPAVPTDEVDDDLAILRALERGEIDVAEAGRRLAALDVTTPGGGRDVR